MGTVHRQYMLTDRVVEALKKMADGSGISVNSVVKTILDCAIEEGVSPDSHPPKPRHRLSVYVTKQQDEWIRQQAAKKNLSASDFVEQVVQLILNNDEVDLNLAIRKVPAGTDHQDRIANSA